MIEEFPAKLKEAVEKNQAEYAMLKERMEVFAPFADKLREVAQDEEDKDAEEVGMTSSHTEPPESDKTNTWEEETNDDI